MQPTPQLPKSLWAATAEPAPQYEVLPPNSAASVVIIGAGYVGLSTALHLAQQGHNVFVLDSAEPGWGASGRNGGQIISGLKHFPDELEETFGSERGSRIVKTMGASGQLVYDLIDRYGIRCHDKRAGWIQAAHARVAAETLLLKRYTQWNARGVRSKLLDARETAELVGSASDMYVGAWFDPRGGVLQPLSYARGLAGAVIGEGGRIFKNAHVVSLRDNSGRWIVETMNGLVTADKVVIATNAYTDDLWPGLARTVVPVSSFQAATVPLPENVRKTILPGGQGVTDTRRLLHYFRQDHMGRLVMGGRSPVDENPGFTDAGSLRHAIARTFPQAADIEFEFVWSGKVALTKDSLPHVHLLAPNLFTALGCNGRGVANATMIGKCLSSIVGGSPLSEMPIPVTTPDPFLFHAFRKIGILAATTYYRLMDQLEARHRANTPA